MTAATGTPRRLTGRYESTGCAVAREFTIAATEEQPPRLSATQRRRAALEVCRRAHDMSDAVELLGMLGLIETPPPPQLTCPDCGGRKGGRGRDARDIGVRCRPCHDRHHSAICKRGHPLSDADLNSAGAHDCRICRRARAQRKQTRPASG